MNIKLMFLCIAGLITISTSVQAQAKNKKTSAPTKTVTSSTNGGINASNYGKVIQYLNGTIECMNEQRNALAQRGKVS